MAFSLERDGRITLKMGDDMITVSFQRPGPSCLIETLVQKMPRGDEAEDAHRMLLANLELGRTCITGIEQGELSVGGAPLVTDPQKPGYREGWKDLLAESCPLILIALGQHLSALPSFAEGSSLKKTSDSPGKSCKAD